MALGGALFEQIDFAGGRILNASLSEYRVPRLPGVPEVDVLLLDRPGLAPRPHGDGNPGKLSCQSRGQPVTEPGGGIVPGPVTEQASAAAVSPGAASGGRRGNVGRPAASAPRSRKSVRSLALASR
jgi:hypothetical protein